MRTFPEAEIKHRLSRFSKSLSREDIGCAIIAQNVDRLYYSGSLQDGILLVGSGCEPVLFVRRTLSRAREESPLDTVIGMTRLEEVSEYIKDTGLHRGRIGIEMDVLPVKLYRALAEYLPNVSFVDISATVRMQRAVKLGFEIELLTESGRRFDRVFAKLRKILSAGMSEYEIYMRFISLLLEEGSSLTVRTRTFNMEAEQKYIVSGENAAKHSAMDSPSACGIGVTVAFPSGASHQKVGRNEPLLVDAVFIHEGYMVDCTRIFAFGDLAPELKRAHAVSGACHEMFCEAVAEGESIPEIYRKINEYVEKQRLSDTFMGGVRFIGHGVGLELDEFPVITGRFEGELLPGMAVAFEPKFIFPGGAVGYENTYIVEADRRARSLNQFDTAIQYV